MNLQAIEHEILSLATEDYQGLWEIRSQVEQLWPALGQDVKKTVTQAALNLLERGWVEIFEGVLDGRATSLPQDVAKETLRGATAWDLRKRASATCGSLRPTPANRRTSRARSPSPHRAEPRLGAA